MKIIIISSFILAVGLIIRHIQLKLKHAMNAYRFEKGKHDEYKQAYYAKGDELETCQTMLGMAKFDKKQAERKAAESEKQVTELRESLEVGSAAYASLLEQMAKVEKEASQLAREFTVKSQDLAKANDFINKVHDLLNSGAKG